MKVWIKEGQFGICTEVQMGAPDQLGGLTVVMPMQTKYFSKEELDSGKLYPLPVAMELPRGDAHETLQSFMDALWNAGYRPKDIGTAGHLAATQAHLEDMRVAFFHQLGLPIPQKIGP